MLMLLWCLVLSVLELRALLGHGLVVGLCGCVTALDYKIVGNAMVK